MSDRVFSKIATENNISIDDAKYVYERSEKLMPILLQQYKLDFNMICLKLKEYQKILIKNCKKNNT